MKKLLLKLWTEIRDSFISLYDDSSDPVRHCEVYKDRANGSCAHVDGMLCDFPHCSIRKNYLEERRGTVN